MTNTLKLTKVDGTIAVRITLDTMVKPDSEGNYDLAGVIALLDERMLKASRNIADHDEVMIDSKGRMTCTQEPEADEKGNKKGDGK